MAQKFRELIVWQRAMALATEIYTISREFPREEMFGLTSQLRRAAISIALNIAEGSGSDSSAEFARFLTIALRSAYETMAALELAERLNYQSHEIVEPLLRELDDISAMLSVLSKRIRERGDTKNLRETGVEYSHMRLHDAVLSDYRLLTTDYLCTIRPATIDDAETLAALIRAAFGEYDGVLDPPSGAFKETTEKLRADLEHEQAVLALVDGEPVGCALHHVVGDHMYFGRLSVLPAYRKHGIGAALIAQVEAEARRLGLPKMRLGVRVALPHLRARYERLGYRVCEERMHAGYTVPTYLILEKIL